MIIVFGTREYSERAIMQLPSILQRQLFTDCYHDNGRWGVYVYSEFPTKRFWWLEGECDSELGGFWDGELCVSNHHQSRRTFSMAPAFSDSNFESSAKNTWFNWLKNMTQYSCKNYHRHLLYHLVFLSAFSELPACEICTMKDSVTSVSKDETWVEKSVRPLCQRLKHIPLLLLQFKMPSSHNITSNALIPQYYVKFPHPTTLRTDDVCAPLEFSRNLTLFCGCQSRWRRIHLRWKKTSPKIK